jgi:hypothetical protein
MIFRDNSFSMLLYCKIVSVMCSISLIGMFGYKSFMSNVIRVVVLLIFISIKSWAICVEFCDE